MATTTDRSTPETTIETWDLRRGGRWRYVNGGPDGETYCCFGSFHDVRPDERIVQTFTFEGCPDAVFLEAGVTEGYATLDALLA